MNTRVQTWLTAHRRRIAAAACAFAALVCGTGVAIVAWPMDTSRYLTVNASGQMLDRNGRPLYAYLNGDESWCFPKPVDAISAHLVNATIATEDQRFHAHHGVDLLAVVRAAWTNLSSVDIRSGASTLTMQIVKQASSRDRSFSNKAIQAVQAVRLDARVDKDTLLETYLNRAPYGMNLIGCEAASRRYFGKSARELTLPEAALIAGLPKAPSAYMPIEHAGRARDRRNFVLGRMLEEGFITATDHAWAVAAPLGAGWHDFESASPHLAQRLRKQALEGGEIHTTLVRDYQNRAEQLVQEHLKHFRGSVTNAAAIVLSVPEAEVLAHVGSADFFATPGGGQVDACRAPRSPGSALKPFTYALALERNRLYPSEVLLDNLLDYGRYQPVNFDGTYRGLTTASLALRRSLNVPAVAVLDRTGYENVYVLLKEFEFTTLSHEASHYGLGLTLGNCEVKLEEAAAAYAAIASLGDYRRPSTVLGERAAPKRVLKPGTCAALYQMMEQPLPAEFDATYFPSENGATRVCWKTGTSTGLHDAWAFVFNAHYVVGVWLGNNDGRSSRQLVGARAALPLAGSIFRSLPPLSTPAWPDVTQYLKDTTVCAVTGLPASEWCEKRKTELIPKEQFLHRACDVHRPAAAQEGAVFAVARSVERWPGSARNWDLARVETPAIAQAQRSKNDVSRKDSLRILVPSDESEFVLTGEAQGDRIRLQSSRDEEATLHWYVDGRYAGESTVEKRVYLNLEQGVHKLTCMDGSGAQDSVSFTVQKPVRSPWR